MRIAVGTNVGVGPGVAVGIGRDVGAAAGLAAGTREVSVGVAVGGCDVQPAVTNRRITTRNRARCIIPKCSPNSALACEHY